MKITIDDELEDFLTAEKWLCDNYRDCRDCPRYNGDCFLPLDEWLKQPAEEQNTCHMTSEQQGE